MVHITRWLVASNAPWFYEFLRTPHVFTSQRLRVHEIKAMSNSPTMVDQSGFLPYGVGRYFHVFFVFFALYFPLPFAFYFQSRTLPQKKFCSMESY